MSRLTVTILVLAVIVGSTLLAIDGGLLGTGSIETSGSLDPATPPPGPAGVGPASAMVDDADPAEPVSSADARLNQPDAGISATRPPRTTAGLREQPVEMRLPVVAGDSFPEAPNTVPMEEVMARRAALLAANEPHPLAPREQVPETNDGPLGPNPIPVNPAAPGPADVLPEAAVRFAARPAGGTDVAVDPDGDGPAMPLTPAEIAVLTGPGQGVFDPDDPGPDETGGGQDREQDF